jgi:hypothetical protein
MAKTIPFFGEVGLGICSGIIRFYSTNSANSTKSCHSPILNHCTARANAMIAQVHFATSSASSIILRSYLVSAPSRCSPRAASAPWTQQKLSQRLFHRSANGLTKPNTLFSEHCRTSRPKNIIAPRSALFVAQSRHFSSSRAQLDQPSPSPSPVTSPAKNDASSKSGPSEEHEGVAFHPEEPDAVNVIINQVPPVWLLRKDSRYEGESLPKYALSIGRAYLKFFMGGRRNIGVCKRKAAYIREQTGFDARQAINDQLQHGDKYSLPEDISRSDFQLLLRSRNDRLRQPIFVLLVLVFGETLPIWLYLFRRHIVPFLPYTCRTEQQQLQLQDQREQAGHRIYEQAAETSSTPKDSSPSELTREEAIARGLGLPLTPAFLQPTSFLISRLAWYRAYLTLDNRLLERDGGPEALSRYEMMLALTDRAFDYTSIGKKPSNREQAVGFMTENIAQSQKKL